MLLPTIPSCISSSTRANVKLGFLQIFLNMVEANNVIVFDFYFKINRTYASPMIITKVYTI